jgi:hypothetical protein
MTDNSEKKFVWIVREHGRPNIPFVERYVFERQTAKRVIVRVNGGTKHLYLGDDVQAFFSEAEVAAYVKSQLTVTADWLTKQMDEVKYYLRRGIRPHVIDDEMFVITELKLD